MFAYLSAIIIAFALSILQLSALSHLSMVFASVSLLLAATCVAIVSGYDLEAAAIALVGGMMLDLHGLLGFGSEIAAAFAAFAVMRVLFSRFLSNANLLSVFLLALAGVLTRFVLLAGIDGLRVLAGQDPYLLVLEPELLTGPLLTILTTGLMAVVVIALGRAVEQLTKQFFLRSSRTLKL